jgi:hypothetical protein
MEVPQDEDEHVHPVEVEEGEDDSSSEEEKTASPQIVAPRVVKGKKKKVVKKVKPSAPRMFVPPAAAAAAAPSASAPPAGGGNGSPLKIEGELDELPFLPESELHTLESVIRKADVSGPTTDKKLRQIQKLFNHGRE